MSYTAKDLRRAFVDGAWMGRAEENLDAVHAEAVRRYPDAPESMDERLQRVEREKRAGEASKYAPEKPARPARRGRSVCTGCDKRFEWAWYGEPWHWREGKQCGPVVVEESGSAGEK